MAAYDFPDTAGKPTDGSFEYTAPDGTLYEWNGYAWVVPADESSGGGGGGAARVLTQVLPPSPAEDGDMYWCTDDGRLYLYYDDADTKQWVDASPDGGGSSPATYWDRNGTALSPSTAGDGISVDGSSTFASGLINLYNQGYIRSQRTNGSDISINGGATSAWQVDNNGTVTSEISHDGSASFAGIISNGTILAPTPGAGSVFTATGQAAIYQATAAVNTQFSLQSDIGSTKNDVFKIDSDGTTRIGGAIPAAPNITLNSDGQSVFSNKLSITNGPGGKTNFKVAPDGSMVFNGTLSAEGLTGSPSAGQTLKRIGSEVFVDTSTRASKENIVPLVSSDAIEVTKALRPVNYIPKGGGDLQIGFIAEEVLDVLPAGAIVENGQAVSVAYDRLSAICISALQQVLSRIETLEEINASLEARLTALEGGNN